MRGCELAAVAHDAGSPSASPSLLAALENLAQARDLPCAVRLTAFVKLSWRRRAESLFLDLASLFIASRSSLHLTPGCRHHCQPGCPRLCAAGPSGSSVGPGRPSRPTDSICGEEHALHERQRTVRVSRDQDRGEPMDSAVARPSLDHRRRPVIAFVSSATNLVTGDNNGRAAPFVRDD